MLLSPVDVRFLSCKKGSFKKGDDTIEYAQATLIIEGEVIKVSVNRSLFDSVLDIQDKRGSATFNLSASFDSKPKLQLVAFK